MAFYAKPTPISHERILSPSKAMVIFMQQHAIVIRTQDTAATVRVMRQDACAHCQVNCGGGCAKAVEATAQNPIGAAVGDRVCVQSATGRLLAFSATLFCAPILLAICAYFLFASVLASSVWVYVLSIAVGVGSFLCIGLLCDRAVRKNPDLTIIQIIEPAGAENGETDDRA